jgi:heat shock protein HslJ
MTKRPLLRLALLTLLASPPGMVSACSAPLEPQPTGGQAVEPSYSVGRIAGMTWVAVEIDGVPVPDSVEVDMAISHDGTVSGTAGCNRFSGSVELDAAVMVFSPLRVTRMACDPLLMDVEKRFLEALGSVEGFAVDSDNRVTLLRADGTVAVLLRP